MNNRTQNNIITEAAACLLTTEYQGITIIPKSKGTDRQKDRQIGYIAIVVPP